MWQIASKNDCRDEVERLCGHSTGKPLPNVGDVFVAIAVGRTWKRG